MKPKLPIVLLNSIFLGALLVPVAALGFSPKFRPALSALVADANSFSAQFESLKRATPLIAGTISFYNSWLYRAGISPNPGQMTMGKEGYMFLGNDHYHAYDQITHRYPIEDAQVKAWVDGLASERAFLAKRGIPLVFVVAPSTGTIYADKIAYWPPGFAEKKSLFDAVLAEAAKKDLPIVDVRAELVAARAKAETYSKLNSHWNDYGAWVAWQKIGKRIEDVMPGVHVAGLGGEPRIEVVDSGSEGGGLVHVEARNDWTRVVRQTTFPDYLIHKGYGNDVAVSGETQTDLLELPRDTSSPRASSKIRVLAIRDSMGNAISPYLTASFSDLRQLNNHVRMAGVPKLDFAKEVDDYKPQLVVYVMTERYLAVALDVMSNASNEVQKLAALPDSEAWPQQGSLPVPEVKADPTLNKPSSIKLAGPDGVRLLQIEVQAEGPSALYVGYQVGGKSTEGWHEVVAGKNMLSIALPEKIDGNYIWIVRTTDRAVITLTGVKVKATSSAASVSLPAANNKLAALPDSEAWPQQGSLPVPEVKADPTLNKPSSIKLAGPDGVRLLQIEVQAEGPSALYVGYQVGGKSTEGWHEVVAGKNMLSIALPEKIDGNYIWIVRTTDRAVITLTGVKVKAAL